MNINLKNINWLTVFKEYSLFLVGLTLYVIAWVTFILPHGITGGGVTGISSMIYYATNHWIPISYSYFVINVALLIIGTLVLGKGFGFKTVFCVLVSSLMFEFYPQFMWESDIEDKLLNAIIGGGLAGAGLSIVLLNGGSTGGIDIIVMIINKFKQIAPGKLFLFFDVIIVGSYVLLPDMHVKDIVYGYIVMVVMTYVIDLMMNGVQSSVQVMITSKDYEKIGSEIAGKMDRGVTMMNSKGWYLRNDMETLMVVIRKGELNDLKKIIKSIDSDAFYTVTPTTAVYGRGFNLEKRLLKKD